MKLKRLFTLAALLTSSLAGAVDSGDLENKYYVGFTTGVGYGSGFTVDPSLVIGYHYDKSSKLELEINGDVGFGPLAIGSKFFINYRYYPDFDIDPVLLYVSGGLGGGLQIIPFGILGTGGTDAKPNDITQAPIAPYADGDATTGGSDIVNKILNSVVYKLKIGVDYAFTPQIIGAVGLMAGASVGHLIKGPNRIPTAVLEIGVRYNF